MKIAPETIKELEEYLSKHGLEATISKFVLKAETSNLELFGINADGTCTIQLTLNCTPTEEEEE